MKDRFNWLRKAQAPVEQRALGVGDLPSSMVVTSLIDGAASVGVRQAAQLPDVSAAIAMVGGLFASCRLEVVRDAANGEGSVPIPSAPAQALFDRPEDGVSGAAWRARIGLFMLLYRECFLGLARDASGRVAGLYLYDPSVVGVEVKRGRRVYSLPDAFGVPQQLDSRDAIHCLGPSLDGIRAMSPVRSSPLAFAMAKAVSEHALKSFSGGARPSTIVSVSGGPEVDDLMVNLRRDLSARSDGVAVVDASTVAVQQLGANNQQADLIAAGRWTSQLVMRALGLPAALVGEQTGGSLDYSNTEAQMASVAGLHCRPLFEYVAQAISLNDELCPGATRARFNFADLPADPSRGFGTDPSPQRQEAPFR